METPDACTLPTAERPMRLAEFDDLFATAVREVELLNGTHARLRLTGPAGLEAKVRDLVAREAACCSFFAFTVTVSENSTLTLEVRVPARYADVLTSLTDRAASISARP